MFWLAADCSRNLGDLDVCLATAPAQSACFRFDGLMDVVPHVMVLFASFHLNYPQG